MRTLVITINLLSFLFASNGKITGTVIQKGNSNPAVGVNVILVDTYLGAATDENGRFTILNIPPGTYSIRVDAIGFATVTMKDVRVTTEQTTELSFKLQEAVVEWGCTAVMAHHPVKQWRYEQSI